MGCGVNNVKKKDPPFFFVLKMMNLLVFFDFERKKCFRVPTPWGLYGEWDGCLCSLCTFQPFLRNRRFWRPWRPCGTQAEGCKQGCCDSLCLLGYKRAFFAASKLPQGRSWPV